MRDDPQGVFPALILALRARPSLSIALLLGISLTMRTGLALALWKLNGHAGFLVPDSLGYIEAARALLHGSFSSPAGPEMLRTPGYPLILMPAVLSRHLEIFALLENFLLASFSVWLVWKLTLRVFKDPNAALWAAVLFCCEPLQLEGSVLVMTETIFCALILVLVYFLVRFMELPSYQNLLCAALALILAIYTRPVAMFLAIWLAPLLLFIPHTLSRRRRIVRAIVFPVAVTLALLPWIVRNERVAQYQGFSTASDNNLYYHDAAAIEAKILNKTLLQERIDRGYYDDNVYFQSHPGQRLWAPGEIWKFRGKEALETISRHPGYFVWLQIKGWANVIFNPTTPEVIMNFRLYPRTSGLLHEKLGKGPLNAGLWFISRFPALTIIVVVMELQLLIYYSLTMLGLRALPGSFRLLFLSAALYFILVSGGPIAASRYRLPIMPLVCISAGIAMAKLQDNDWQRTGNRKSSRRLG